MSGTLSDGFFLFALVAKGAFVGYLAVGIARCRLGDQTAVPTVLTRGKRLRVGVAAVFARSGGCALFVAAFARVGDGDSALLDNALAARTVASFGVKFVIAGGADFAVRPIVGVSESWNCRLPREDRSAYATLLAVGETRFRTGGGSAVYLDARVIELVRQACGGCRFAHGAGVDLRALRCAGGLAEHYPTVIGKGVRQHIYRASLRDDGRDRFVACCAAARVDTRRRA